MLPSDFKKLLDGDYVLVCEGKDDIPLKVVTRNLEGHVYGPFYVVVVGGVEVRMSIDFKGGIDRLVGSVNVVGLDWFYNNDLSTRFMDYSIKG